MSRPAEPSPAEPRPDRGDLFWIHPADPGAPAHPHVVLQDDAFNHSRIPTVVVAALTTNLHRGTEPGNVLLDEGEGDLPKRSVVVVSQLSSAEKAQLGARIGCLSPARVDQILAGLRFQQRSFFRADDSKAPAADTMPAAERIAPVLPVRDVAAALEHYRRLGCACDAYREADASGPIYGFVHFGGVELHLTRTPNLDPWHNTSACYLYVAEVDALHARWAAAGVAGRLSSPIDTPYGLREMAHVDPDGNLLRIGAPMAVGKRPG